MKDWVNISQRLIMLGQLGLSLVMPVLICMGACYLLTSRVGLGLWIYFFYDGLQTMDQSHRERAEERRGGTSCL